MKRVFNTVQNLQSSLRSKSLVNLRCHVRSYASRTPSPHAMAQALVQPSLQDILLPSTPHYISNPILFNPIQKPACYSLVGGVGGMAKRPNQPQDLASDLLGNGYGEDSYFMRNDSMGIADGVGGWSLNKGNSTFYSRRLMHYAHTELNKYDDIDTDEFTLYDQADPTNILAKSYDRTNFDAYMDQIKGSSTALIALLRGDELRIANLGDCGLAIIRDGDFLFRSEEQQHAFNFPYQLGIVGGDNPLSSQKFKIKVQKGDIIILGSDGLFDNLYDEDILEIVQSTHRTSPSIKSIPDSVRLEVRPQLIADTLVQSAREVAENSRHYGSSPFTERAAAEGLYHQGGKLDDITVLVGVVWDHEDSPDRR